MQSPKLKLYNAKPWTVNHPLYAAKKPVFVRPCPRVLAFLRSQGPHVSSLGFADHNMRTARVVVPSRGYRLIKTPNLQMSYYITFRFVTPLLLP